jgi:hypothetical protein
MVFMFMNKNLLSQVIHESVGNFLLERNSESGLTDANRRRERDDWNPDKGYSGDEGSQATALFNYLVSSDNIDPSYDVYDIIYDGSFYDMGLFYVVDDEDKKWIVGTEEQTYETAKDNLKDMIEGDSIDTFFSNDFILGAIDMRKFNQYVREYFSDTVYDSPEDWLESSQRQLSEKQQDFLNYLNFKLEKLPSNLDKMDSDQRTQVEEKISEIHELIEEIDSDPQGEFSDETIQEYIDEMFMDYKDDPESFFGQHYGEYDGDLLSRIGLLDLDDLITQSIDSDGPEHMISMYDGDSNQIKLYNDYYTIIRHS